MVEVLPPHPTVRPLYGRHYPSQRPRAPATPALRRSTVAAGWGPQAKSPQATRASTPSGRCQPRQLPGPRYLRERQKSPLLAGPYTSLPKHCSRSHPLYQNISSGTIAREIGLSAMRIFSPRGGCKSRPALNRSGRAVQTASHSQLGSVLARRCRLQFNERGRTIDGCERSGIAGQGVSKDYATISRS